MPQSKKLITYLTLIDSIATSASYLFVAILSVYILSLNGDLTHYGDLAGIFAVTYGGIAIFCSKYLLKHRNMLLTGSYLMWIFYSIMLISSSNSVKILYFAIFINGVALAIRSVMFFAKLQDYCQDSNDLILTSSNIGFIGKIIGSISAMVGSYLAHHYGYSYLFYTMLSLYVLSFFFSSYLTYSLRRLPETELRKDS